MVSSYTEFTPPLMKTAPYKDPELPVEERIDDLLSRMTREEKIGQLGQVSMADYANQREIYLAGVKAGRWGSRILAETAWAGNNAEAALNVIELNEIQRVAVEESRLGIPLLYGRDVIYGHRTVFPIPHSQAASFNPELIEKAMTCVAAEASSEGVHWTFSPVLDLVRDPRWGRVIESYSEDPFLIASLGCAAIRGFQGTTPGAPQRLLACAKHFAGYGGEGGRDYDTAEWSENTLRNFILPPFEAVARSGIATMMTGFHDLGGTPVSSNRALLRDWLKDELGWEGFAVSDWGAIYDLIGHGVAKDERAATRLGFTAGIDLEMTAGFYERNLAPLIDEGEIPESWLDDAVSRILRAKFRAGLFERPFTDPGSASRTMRRPEHLALAAQLAEQSVVLLKNKRDILPLDPALRKIAVVGPYAQALREHLGSWCLDGRTSDVTSILDGLRKAAPDVEFLTADAAFSDAMINTARDAELTILCVGESHLRNGENKSIAELVLPPGQEELIAALGRLDLPLVVVDCSGRYLPSAASEACADAIVHAGGLGTEAGGAIARILLGHANPSGKLPVTVPRSSGQIPIYYNRKTVGKAASFKDRYRGYEDELLKPLYPFGYGLSYTTFELGEARLSASTMTSGEEVTASATLTNCGPCRGAETVQLYISDPVASTTRPGRELKGFRRVELDPGASVEVSFKISPSDLRFYTANGTWEAEPGEFRIGIGADSTVPLPLTLTLCPVAPAPQSTDELGS